MTSIEHRNLLLQHWDHEYNSNKCPVHVSSQQSTRAVGTGRHGALPCGQPGSSPRAELSVAQVGTRRE